MAEVTFNTADNRTIGREMMVAYLDVGTGSASEWAGLGYRVEDSSISYEMDKSTVRDIHGKTYTTMKKPTKTQSFDNAPLVNGDKAVQKLWKLGIHDEDVQSLANMKVLVAHYYAGSENAAFAEMYDACAISISENGGDPLAISYEITYGGNRVIGNVSRTAAGVVTFTPEVA